MSFAPRRATSSCLLGLAVSCGAAAAGEEPPRATFGDQIEVRLFTVRVRVFDRAGTALPGLRPADFEVDVGKIEAQVIGADWVPPGPGPESGAASASEAAPARAASAETPRLVVLFLQSSAEPHRYLGLWRTLKRLDPLLSGLHPSDRVAVVSFQHHLELRSHFTLRRNETRAAVDAAVRLRRRPARFEPGDGPRLEVDAARGRAAAFVEQGLEMVAEALAPLPGDKILLFIGWGLGVEHGGAVTPHYRRALGSLRSASVTVSSLAVGDLVHGVSSNLDRALARLAEDTGGHYAKLAPFLDLAIRRFRQSLEGHYLVSFSVPPEASGRLRIRLRDRRLAVHHAPYVLERHGMRPVSVSEPGRSPGRRAGGSPP